MGLSSPSSPTSALATHEGTFAPGAPRSLSTTATCISWTGGKSGTWSPLQSVSGLTSLLIRILNCDTSCVWLAAMELELSTMKTISTLSMVSLTRSSATSDWSFGVTGAAGRSRQAVDGEARATQTSRARPAPPGRVTPDRMANLLIELRAPSQEWRHGQIAVIQG